MGLHKFAFPDFMEKNDMDDGFGWVILYLARLDGSLTEELRRMEAENVCPLPVLIVFQ